MNVLYSDIYSIVRLKHGVLIGRSGALPVFIRRDVLSEFGSVDTFVVALRDRIGAVKSWEIDQRERVFHRLLKPPRMTLALIVVLGLIHSFTSQYVGENGYLQTVQFGAFVGELVSDGEIYRLVTAPFLHLNREHLVSNILVLLFFGWLVEGLIGSQRMAILLFASTVSGALANQIAVMSIQGGTTLYQAVGCSAGLWGLFGSWIVLWTRRRSEMPVGFRIPVVHWAFVLVQILALMLQWTPENVEGSVHSVGAIVGLAVGYCFVYGGSPLPLARSRIANWTTGVVACIVLISAGAAIFDGVTSGSSKYYQLLMDRLVNPGAEDIVRNNLSDLIATSDPVSEKLLKVAYNSMVDLVDRDPKAEYRDTLAMLLQRSGETRSAVSMMRSVWTETRSRRAASQLARMYAASGQSLSDVAVVELVLSESDDSADFQLSLDAAPLENSFLHALMFDEEGLVAFLDIAVGAGARDTRCPFSLSAIHRYSSHFERIRPVWIGAGAGDSHSGKCKFTWLDREVLSYP